MSKFRFSLSLIIDTPQHAQTIKTSIQNQLIGKDIFDEFNFRAFLDSVENKIKINADWRFNSRADRDAFRDWVKDQLQVNPQVKDWILSGSSLTWHKCFHDDEIEPVDCSTSQYGEFIK